MIVSLNCFVTVAAEKWTKAHSVLSQETVDRNYIAVLYCSVFLRGVILRYIVIFRGMRWRSWLRHCATSWQVAGSIPDSVSGFFH
jgi:hypothetical protein